MTQDTQLNVDTRRIVQQQNSVEWEKLIAWRKQVGMPIDSKGDALPKKGR